MKNLALHGYKCVEIHWIRIRVSLFFKIFYLFIFRERAREGEREGEKHQHEVASHVVPSGDLAHNPGTCPDWESNQQPFSPQHVLIHGAAPARAE